VIAVPFLIAALCKHGGFGDAWLIAAASLTLGLGSGAVGLILGMSILCIFALVRKLRGKGAPKTESLPFASFLAPGFIAAYFI
jgi:prepilin signal peptidase PulO-like enzyme (type II secretory pathway)